jgi:acyl transferase domain-containing protein
LLLDPPKLFDFQNKKEVTGLFSAQLSNTTHVPKVTFLFTGQGSQYINMGKELYQTEPLFRQVLEQCDRILSSEFELDHYDIIFGLLERMFKCLKAPPKIGLPHYQ